MQLAKHGRRKSDKMKNIVHRIVLFLLVIGLAEAGSYGVLYALGESSKSFSKIYDPTGNTARVKGRCDDYVQTLEFNPYLAYTRNKQCAEGYRINNLGLLNQDADIEKKQFYSVGIFGGSVATIFAGSNSAPQLEEILNDCFNSNSGKPFRVLNFAEGDWKQPQQVIALALYGDYIDAAISIEGYNEHWLLMPGTVADLILPPQTYSSLENDNFFARDYFMLSRLQGLAISHSNIIKLSTFLFRRILEKRGWNAYLKSMEKYSVPSGIDVHNHNINRYAGFLKSFDAIAMSKNIYSLIVVQPSPLYKKLSSAESEILMPPDYKQQYKEIAFLIERNASRFLNLTELFAKEEKTIYKDPIHFAQNENGKSVGNYQMSVEIIHRLVADKQVLLTPKSDSCVAGHQIL
jgi:hypothetical protein